MVAPRLLGAGSDGDRDPRRPQPRVPLPGHFRVRVLHRRDDPRDAGRDDRLGAGRRLADMRAGLERHVEGRAARRLARLGDRDRLGMRPPARRGDAAADDYAVLDQNGADGRVRRGETQRPLPQIERRVHPAKVFVRVFRRSHCAEVSLRFRPPGSTAGSGSPSSSPTMALKSRASRKLR